MIGVIYDTLFNEPFDTYCQFIPHLSGQVMVIPMNSHCCTERFASNSGHVHYYILKIKKDSFLGITIC